MAGLERRDRDGAPFLQVVAKRDTRVLSSRLLPGVVYRVVESLGFQKKPALIVSEESALIDFVEPEASGKKQDCCQGCNR